MKSFFFSFLLLAGLFFQNNATAQDNINIVGQISNGEPVLTVSQNELIQNLSCNLRNLSGITADFTRVSITNDGEGYLLHFYGGTYASNIRLTVDAGGYMIASATSCTTSECSSETFGCTPNIYGACRECSNKGKCTKTVTSSMSLVRACAQ